MANPRAEPVDGLLLVGLLLSILPTSPPPRSTHAPGGSPTGLPRRHDLGVRAWWKHWLLRSRRGLSAVEFWSLVFFLILIGLTFVL